MALATIDQCGSDSLRLGRRSVRRFLIQASSGDPLVRLEVVRALGFCGGPKSIAALIDRLDDTDWEVRRMPCGFSDTTKPVSGKHFGQSRTVR